MILTLYYHFYRHFCYYYHSRFLYLWSFYSIKRISWIESTGRFLLLGGGPTPQYNTARGEPTGPVPLHCRGTDPHAVSVHYAVVRGGSGTGRSRALLRGYWIILYLLSFRQFVPPNLVHRLCYLWIILPRSNYCLQHGHFLSKKGERIKFLKYLLHVLQYVIPVVYCKILIVSTELLCFKVQWRWWHNKVTVFLPIWKCWVLKSVL